MKVRWCLPKAVAVLELYHCAQAKPCAGGHMDVPVETWHHYHRHGAGDASPDVISRPHSWPLSCHVCSTSGSLLLPTMPQPHLSPSRSQRPPATPAAPRAPGPDSHQQDVRHGLPRVMGSSTSCTRHHCGMLFPLQPDHIKEPSSKLGHVCNWVKAPTAGAVRAVASAAAGVTHRGGCFP